MPSEPTLTPRSAGDSTPTREPAQEATSVLVTECDRLAANPVDENRVTPGVLGEHLEPEWAIAACREAVSANPGVHRLEYQLGRSLMLGGQHEEALTISRALYDHGYTAAAYTIAYYYLEIARDDVRAADLYRSLADQGEAPAQFSLGLLYEQAPKAAPGAVKLSIVSVRARVH